MIATAYWFFVAVVVLAPLPYGSVHLWSSGLLAMLTGAATVLWAVAAAISPRACPVGWRHYAVPGAMFAAVLLWVGLQACPETPAAWHDPLWAAARTALGTDAAAMPGAISIDPDATLLALMHMATYGAIFWIAMQLGHDRRRAMLALWAIALAGVAYAAYGIGVQASGTQTILFAKKWAYQGSLTSTFVNRNHYAIYAGLGLTVSVALMLVAARRKAQGALASPMMLLRALEQLDLRVFVLAVNCMAIATALIMTQSRGGALFTAAALVSVVLLLGWGGNMGRRSTGVVLTTMLLGGVFIVAASGDGIVARIVAPAASAGRAEIHALTERAIAAAPWTGHGAGSFPHLFGLYRDAAFPPISPAYTAAHSVYLEMFSDIGLIAGTVWFAAIGWIVLTCVRAARRGGTESVVPAVATAVAVLIGLQSLVDFGAQIPAIAVTFAAVLGIGYARSVADPAQNGERRRRRRNGADADRYGAA